MSLIIEEALNGFILKESDGRVIMVIQEPENMDDRDALAESGATLLWKIIDHFGLYGSKYDAKRVRVSLEPGYCHADYSAYLKEEYGVRFEDEGTSWFTGPTWWQRFWSWLWTR